MKHFSFAALFVFVLSICAFAQTPLYPVHYTVATLPAASTLTNKVVSVTDGLTKGDCTVGGGVVKNACISDGSSWLNWGGDGTGAGGTLTDVSGTAPINSSHGSTPAISIDNAKADGSTKGAADFLAADFNDDGAGKISIDYTNGQAADATHKGFLTSGDWGVFSAKQPALGFTPENAANKDVANGYAGLDASVLLKRAEFPAATVFNDQANIYTAGMKQSFQANGTNAGSRWVGVSADPSTLQSGDVWYNTTSTHFKANNGATKTFMFADDSLPFSQLTGVPNFLVDCGSNGFLARTALNTTLCRTFTGTTNRLTITNTTGGGDPVFNVPDAAQLNVAKIVNLTGNGFIKTGSSDGSLSIDTTIYVPQTRTITEGVGLAGNTYDLSANRTLNMGTPSTLTVSTSNALTSTSHTHAITSSSSPGATASLLSSNASGYLQLVRLGIGGAPSQPLEVTGNVFINSATANLFLKDIQTGLMSSANLVVNPQPNNVFRSGSFVSGLVGWSINEFGSAEFDNVDARGAIHAGIFAYNSINVTAGTQLVTPSGAKLKNDVVIPASPTYLTTTFAVDVNDQDGITHAASQLFAVNDIIQLKDGLVGSTWGRVVSVSDQTTFWRYTATIQAGTNNVTYRAGQGVPDFGVAGKGGIVLTADQANAPYLQMYTHGGLFTSNDASGSLTMTPQLRLGNLNGSYGFASDIYGFGAGQYGTASKSWITVEQTNGFRVGNNTTVRAQIAIDGSGFFANNLFAFDTSGNVTISGNAVIAGWTIGATRISNTNLFIDQLGQYISGGATPPTSYGSNVGFFLEGANSGRLSLYKDANNYLQWDNSKLLVKAANFTLDASGNITATNVTLTGAVNATSGNFSGVSLTGLMTMSGASSAIAIGTTPPTSASAGTGIWLDRTGMYGLLSGVVQAKFDAVTGAITAAAGGVVLDSAGITLNANGSNLIKWSSSGSQTGALASNSSSGLTFAILVAYSTATNPDSLVRLTTAAASGAAGTFDIKTVNSTGFSYAHLYNNVGTGLAGLLISSSGGIGDANAMLDVRGDAIITGLLKTGSGPITLTDAGGKILSAALNTVAVANGGTGNTSGTATINANLTGPITSSGNATSVASQTGTGTTFVMSASPSLTGKLNVSGAIASTSFNAVNEASIVKLSMESSTVAQLAIWGSSTGTAGSLNIIVKSSDASINIVALAVSAAGNVGVGALLNLKNYTVATLPAGTRGDVAYCTDLLAPGFLVTAVGGGAIVGPVFFNGVTWVAF